MIAASVETTDGGPVQCPGTLRTCRILCKSFRQVLVAKMRMPGSLVSSSIAAVGARHFLPCCRRGRDTLLPLSLTSRHGAWGNAWSHVQQSASSPPRRCARASGTRRGGTWTPKLQADRFAGFQHVRETGPLRRRAVEDIALRGGHGEGGRCQELYERKGIHRTLGSGGERGKAYIIGGPRDLTAGSPTGSGADGPSHHVRRSTVEAPGTR